MHSNVTIKNVSWPHFSWPTLYILHLMCYVFALFGVINNASDKMEGGLPHGTLSCLVSCHSAAFNDDVQ